MIKYIKLNQDNFIIDVFQSHQISKFDGTQIQIEDNSKGNKINNKSISLSNGTFYLKYNNGVITEDTKQLQIDENIGIIIKAKEKLSELDKKMPRGTEDLYTKLKAKGILSDSDMPVDFINNYNTKQTERAKI